MSKVKYLIPVVMGRPGNELFAITGLSSGAKEMALVKHDKLRMVLEKDQKHLDRVRDKYTISSVAAPNRVRELVAIDETTVKKISKDEITLVHGYITGTLPAAQHAPELNEWYLFEGPGEVTPLKLAKFSINLLDESSREKLLSNLSTHARSTASPAIAKFK